MNGCMIEWIYDWMNIWLLDEWIEWMYDWMDVWLNECMIIGWMNGYMIEWM